MVGVIAIGQTLVILTGGIDLSCGMLMALGGIVMTRFATTLGMPPVLAILCGIGVTALFGLVNGLLVTRIRLPSFIVTLGTMNIAFAATQLYSGAQTVTDLPPRDDGAGRHLLDRRHAVRVGHGGDAGAVRASRGSCCARRRPGATSTRWATTPRPRGWWASPRSACCWSSTWWPARCTASPRC